MSDEHSLPVDPALTVGNIARYLGQFKPSACDFCGSTNWTVYTDGSMTAAVVQQGRRVKQPDGGVGMELGGSIPVIQVQCTRCGQMKYFSLSHVLEGIKKATGGASHG